MKIIPLISNLHILTHPCTFEQCDVTTAHKKLIISGWRQRDGPLFYLGVSLFYLWVPGRRSDYGGPKCFSNIFQVKICILYTCFIKISVITMRVWKYFLWKYGGAKIFWKEVWVLKYFAIFWKLPPTGYPVLKKTNPLLCKENGHNARTFYKKPSSWVVPKVS